MSNLVIPIEKLMQKNHDAYPLLCEQAPIPYIALPAFFDMCSHAIDEFIKLASQTSPNDMYESDMVYVLDELISNFHELMTNDDPVEFYSYKKEFEEKHMPNFEHLIELMTRCVDKPERLRRFYSRLLAKVEQAYEHHILGW